MSEALPKPDSGGADPAKRPRGPGVCIRLSVTMGTASRVRSAAWSSQPVRLLLFPAPASPLQEEVLGPSGSGWPESFLHYLRQGPLGQVPPKGNRWTADCRCLQPASARAPAPPG